LDVPSEASLAGTVMAVKESVRVADLAVADDALVSLDLIRSLEFCMKRLMLFLGSG
jgi:hypothetical protein